VFSPALVLQGTERGRDFCDIWPLLAHARRSRSSSDRPAVTPSPHWPFARRRRLIYATVASSGTPAKLPTVTVEGRHDEAILVAGW